MLSKINVSYIINFKKHAGTILVILEKNKITSNKLFRTFSYVSLTPQVLHLQALLIISISFLAT